MVATGCKTGSAFAIRVGIAACCRFLALDRNSLEEIDDVFYFARSTMTKTSSKSVPKNPAETDHDDDDLFDTGEFASLADGLEKETIKRDARRKIEIYWEKKRLKEQFEDFDESEFGF